MKFNDFFFLVLDFKIKLRYIQ